MMYDCIVVGMGPAGMSAGIYAKRSGLKTLILEKKAPGGLINITNLVDNYLGFDNISGPDLVKKMVEHIEDNGVEYKIEEVKKIKKNEDTFYITTDKNEYKSKTVILAGGRQPRKMDIEEKLDNLHISRSSVSEAPYFKNKTLLVIGAGNSAFEEGIYLSDFASELTILARSKVKADSELVMEASKHKNIKIIEGVNLKDIVKDGDKYKVTLDNDKEMVVDGIFSYIGYTPMTEYLSNLNILEPSGYIEVNNTETLVKGMYACGDIIKKEVYQIVTAAGEGAEASVKAKKYIEELDKK